MRFLRTRFFLAVLLAGPALSEEAVTPLIPTGVEQTDFAAVTAQSPFTRSLNLSDSLILTGVARVDDEQVATLLNRETKETFVVSRQGNPQGWKMVELKDDSDLAKVSARISVDGGEVVTVRFAETQLKPGEARPGAGPSEGGRFGGDRGPGGPGGPDGRRGPPPEFREKMMKLSEDQRGKLFEKMREIREKNPDMPREEMGKKMSEVMDKMLAK